MTGETAVVRWDSRRLALREVLGRGGQGVVHAVPDVKIDGVWPAVCKRYAPGLVDQVDEAALEAMVSFPHSLAPEPRAWLGDHAAWPAALLVEEGRTSGFLMRRVPEQFYLKLRVDAGPARVAGFEYLLNPPAYLQRIGLAVSSAQRLTLLAELADTLRRLHAMEVTVGDLSPKNVLFTLEPRPACFIIDCDTMRLRGRDVLRQIETPGWELPSRAETGTSAGDVYKFGLLVVRALSGSQDSYDLGGVRAVSRELATLAQRTMSADPSRRPSLEEWARALAGARRHTVTRSEAHPPDERPRPVSAGPVPAPMRPSNRRRRLAALLSATVLLVLLLIAVAVLMT
ncbi:hypothetical protein [Streptomyces sp. NPDC001480]|uniref:hypothetical protein n=1 Tax=Streptomyces sp. NPDC001480 TaxID=3364577 RepID=UPI0036A5C984